MRDRSPPTILVATDFTPASRAAFDSGVRMAKEKGGRVVLVHAVRPLGAPGLELTRPDTTKFENETAQPSHVGVDADELVDVARSRGVAAEVVVRAGLPAKIILEEALRLGADTVVLGSHRKDDLEEAVLGSVATAVKREADCPVVVVAGVPEPGV